MRIWQGLLAAMVSLVLAGDVIAAGLIFSVSGKASIKPVNGNAYLGLRAGTGVTNGDTIRLEPGASLVLLCSGDERHTLREAIQIVACGVAGSTLFAWGDRKLPAPRSVRRLLLPAGTVVQSDRPAVRWIRGANGNRGSVRVVLRGADHTWERVVADSGELTYPASEKPLARGAAYRFLVLDPADEPTLSSGALNSGFKVMAQGDASALDRVLGEIAADSTLSPAERTHVSARARLLAGLNAETIAQLEAAASNAISDATTMTLLGRAWLQTGCVSCALPVLERAYSITKSAERDATGAEAGRLLVTAYRGSKRNEDAARVEAELASWMAQ